MSPVGEAVELLGYLCEEEDGVARRVGQQRLVAVDHECGDGSGEQPRLRCEMVQEVVGQRLVHKQRDDEAKKKKECCVQRRVSLLRPLSMFRLDSCRIFPHAINIERIRCSRSR